MKFIEIETGNFLGNEFGRCDHESSCQYFLKPDGEINTFVVVDIPKPEPSFHNLELVEISYLSERQNNFIQFLKTLFTDEQVKKAISKYMISTSKHWNGATIFWQIDQLERVHHGKIMLFNPETGKRVKDQNGKGYINSVRSVLKLKDFNLNQSLFGLHLIDENTKVVALVESEKTAVIMSIFKPEYTWLSTGSKSGFKYEYLKPIKDYKIVAFPDKSEYNDWLKMAIELNGFGFKIGVSEILEQTDFENGFDLVDYYLNVNV